MDQLVNRTFLFWGKISKMEPKNPPLSHTCNDSLSEIFLNCLYQHIYCSIFLVPVQYHRTRIEGFKRVQNYFLQPDKICTIFCKSKCSIKIARVFQNAQHDLDWQLPNNCTFSNPEHFYTKTTFQVRLYLNSLHGMTSIL